MPNITVEGPAVNDLEKKRAFARKLTDAACEYYAGIPRAAVVVIVKENAPENVAVGGELICDRIKK